MNDVTLEGPPPWSKPPTATAERVWLTPEQTVRYLGLPSLRALYQSIRRGQVPVHRMGRRLRFARAELDRSLRGDTDK